MYEAATNGSDGDLFVVDVAGGKRRSLRATPELEQPAGWSPNGRKILFTRFSSGTTAAVFVMNADGTGVRRLSAGVAGAWSPDGSKILFTPSPFGSSLFVMNADGSQKHRVASFAASEPDWR